ncbi:DUF5058 family protein [Oceanobacillus polygoni]|uniref:DUF5058 family protein n=1 Tax=Oceanobacillus polygoni TaxID=1235259 RepID=A0A9X1CBC5_9BACI|nr:DUF5058 family protein [Oceanobacillus polygoni]MBP2076811.1 hypothetical protein [Oceanobacillus polygoni]
MQQSMEIANSSVMWVIASLVIGIVIFQSVKFIQLASKASIDVGMSKKEVRSALKTGAIAAIGPSIAIVIVAISLIAFLGNPLTLLRIGVIGSAPIESVGASFAAEASGASLGGEGYNEMVITAIVWTLCLGGMGWLLFTALFTKSLDNMEKKINKGKKGKQIMGVVATAAIVAAFGNLVSAELIRGLAPVVVAVVAATTMITATKLSERFQVSWLREWSLGLSILISLCFGYFFI